jgi:hypothetical protein
MLATKWKHEEKSWSQHPQAGNNSQQLHQCRQDKLEFYLDDSFGKLKHVVTVIF